MARKGLPKSLIKKYGISKKAWRVFRGKKSKSSNPRPKKARKVKKVARRRYSRKRSRRRKSFTLPIAPLVGLAAGMADPIISLTQGDINGAVDHLTYRYLGYDRNTKKMDLQGLLQGTIPLVIGGLVHKFVGGSPVNINRMLANAGVPVVRI